MHISKFFINLYVDSKLNMEINDKLFFKVLSEKTGTSINTECDIFKAIDDYSSIKKDTYLLPALSIFPV